MYHVLPRHLTPRHPPYALIHFCNLCYGEIDTLALLRLYSIVKLRPGVASGGCSQVSHLHPPADFNSTFFYKPPQTKTARHIVRTAHISTASYLYLRTYSVGQNHAQFVQVIVSSFVYTNHDRHFIRIRPPCQRWTSSCLNDREVRWKRVVLFVLWVSCLATSPHVLL